jgi:hypothetical protein
MAGPAPKDPSVRARRNKVSTRAKLRANPKLKAPVLPELVGVFWDRKTLDWWSDVWASPMAPEFDDSDAHGLIALAMIVNDFWTVPTARERKECAAEIRMQSQRFGLSPMDRRRLQWEIERTDEAQAKGARRRATKKASSKDPRAVLRAV